MGGETNWNLKGVPLEQVQSRKAWVPLVKFAEICKRKKFGPVISLSYEPKPP